MNISSSRVTRWSSAAAIALVGTLALSSCAANESATPDEGTTSTLTGTLVGGGSSAQGSAQQAWVAAFQTANQDVTVEYDPTGSGTGRDNFIAGANVFAGSDRAFNDEEIAADNFAGCVAGTGIVEIPAYISPIAVIFNLDGISTLNLDPDTLAGIFKGTITNWNDSAIAAENPDVTLPDLTITAVHRSDDSGTTENFTDYLNAVSPVWDAEADGVWPYDGGEAAAQTSGVVDAVTNGTGTIGYADASRAGDLGTVSVKVGDAYVPYSSEAAAAIIDASPQVAGRGAADLAIEIDRNSDADGVYPIVLVSYLIACAEYQDADNATLVKAYFDYIISPEGQAEGEKSAGSAAISETLYAKAKAAVDSIK